MTCLHCYIISYHYDYDELMYCIMLLQEILTVDHLQAHQELNRI